MHCPSDPETLPIVQYTVSRSFIISLGCVLLGRVVPVFLSLDQSLEIAAFEPFLV